MKLDRDKLIRAREMLGYAIETVAEEAGVSKNSVLRAEHEEDIRPVTARKIATALGVRVADLVGESETLKVQPRLPEFNGESRQPDPRPDYGQLAKGLDRFTEYWRERLEKDALDQHAFEAFRAAAEGLTPWVKVVWDLERAESGVREGALQGGRLWPAIDRYMVLGIEMFRAEKKLAGTHEDDTVVPFELLRRRKVG